MLGLKTSYFLLLCDSLFIVYYVLDLLSAMWLMSFIGRICEVSVKYLRCDFVFDAIEVRMVLEFTEAVETRGKKRSNFPMRSPVFTGFMERKEITFKLCCSCSYLEPYDGGM